MSRFFKIFLIFLLFAQISSQRNKKLQQSQKSLTETDFQKFSNWKKKFGKTYKNPEEEKRAAQKVVDNLREIEAHNELYKAGKETFTRAP